jgi:hypothetical protein
MIVVDLLILIPVLALFLVIIYPALEECFRKYPPPPTDRPIIRPGSRRQRHKRYDYPKSNRMADTGWPNPNTPCFEYGGFKIPKYVYIVGTSLWDEYRLVLMSERGPVCQKCGGTFHRWDLRLHHLRASNLPEDLAFVCVPCHKQLHPYNNNMY